MDSGDKVSGELEIPNLSEEIDMDEVDVSTICMLITLWQDVCCKYMYFHYSKETTTT